MKIRLSNVWEKGGGGVTKKSTTRGKSESRRVKGKKRGGTYANERVYPQKGGKEWT